MRHARPSPHNSDTTLRRQAVTGRTTCCRYARCKAQSRDGQVILAAADSSLPSFSFRVTAKQAASKLRLDSFLAAQIAFELASAAAAQSSPAVTQDVSRAKIQASISAGLVQLNGRPASKASQQLRPGDVVLCTLPPPPPLQAVPEPIALDIRYEDEHLLVINKPAGMVVHVAPGHHSGTLVNALLHHCALPAMDLDLDPNLDLDVDQDPDVGLDPAAHHRGGRALQQGFIGGGYSDADDCGGEGEDEDQDAEGGSGLQNYAGSTTPSSGSRSSTTRGGADSSNSGSGGSGSGSSAACLRPGIVHRLDKGTSGLLVVARSEAALTRLQAQFKARTVDRTYVSITVGCPAQLAGRVEANVVRDPRDRKRMAAAPYGCGRGRTAASGYSVEAPLAGGGAALVRWKLDTGRTHQIRVHAKHIGHPLLGDDTYGGAGPSAAAAVSSRGFPAEQVRECLAQLARPALHALTLGFTHPVTGRRLLFEQPPPEDFERAVRQLQA